MPQSNQGNFIAATGPAHAAQPHSRWDLRSGWFGRGMLLLQVSIAIWVSLSVFRGLMLRGGEEDARGALNMIAAEMDRSEFPSDEDLAAWLRNHAVLQHRLGDARGHGSFLHYHGYRFGWTAQDAGGGTLWARPLVPGTTGQQPFEVRLPYPAPKLARNRGR